MFSYNNFRQSFTRFPKEIASLFKKDPVFASLVVATILITVFFRTYDYFDRIYVHADHSLFLQAAKYSHDTLQIPRIGPFAQAPFFTGPWWLWFLGLLYLIPFGSLTPWFAMTFLSLVFVYLMLRLGTMVGGKWLGSAAAFLAAISPAQVDNSFTVWNAAADSFLALLALIFLIQFYKFKRGVYAFLLGFTVSVAATIHFQTVLLAPLLLVAVITSKPRLKNILFFFLGGFIPLLPFLSFDLQFNWFETKRIYYYFTVDQKRFWIPNRWLTYVTEYWPGTWAYIIGGQKWIGVLIIGLLSFFTLFRLRNAHRYKLIYLIIFSFFLEVVLFRYYSGERFFYYSHFAHAAVILLTAWVIVELGKIKTILGISLGLLVIVFTLPFSFQNLKQRDLTLKDVRALQSDIYANNPGQKFDIYGCIFNGSLISHPLAYFIYQDGRNDISGVKIGACQLIDKSLTWSLLTNEDVLSENSAWLNESTETVFTSMTQWWKKDPPK